MRQQLIADITAAMQCSPQEAVLLIEDHLIGPRKPRRGKDGLCVSSDVDRLLEPGLFRKEKASSGRPVSWTSPFELRAYYVGNDRSITKRLCKLASELAGDIMTAMGCSEQEATNLVAEHLIGRKKPRGGREGIAVSPEVVRIAEQYGQLVHRKGNKSDRGR
ncbi:MAG TPA: hypothetical protein VKU02_04950 [Gemmataceae bacterium]|nr:hypothetical protein [Gemmataceae bacterium]